MRNSVCLSLMLGLLTVMPAMAYDSPNGRCYAERVPGTITYDYVVYFENDRPKANEKDLVKAMPTQAACVKELTEKLNNIPVTADTRIFLLASTDKTASDDYNKKLSDRRLQAVKNLFNIKYAGHLLVHRAGEVEDAFTGTGKKRNPKERAVRIIVATTVEQVREVEKFLSRSEYEREITVINVQNGDAEASAARIRSIAGNIRGLTGSLDASVWKDKQGNFNTSRLVSDSVAGVVLGTAGGLITSNVIKKNQLKGGFQDIKCTVGGQIIAEYGDDFIVGIQ